MPWVTDGNGNKQYKVSIYTKEELPTWDEVYNEFYKKQMSVYDPGRDDHNGLDIYWRIPHRKYIMSIVCNQFNKMIWEDGYKDSLLDFARKEFDMGILGVRFFIRDNYFINDVEGFMKENNVFEQPLIYTFPLPNGNPNPFIIDKNPMIRHDITEDDPTLVYALIPVMYFKDKAIGINYTTTGYQMLIDFMIRPFERYFKGGIGWKDDNGDKIEASRLHDGWKGPGYDPAL